MKGFSKVVVASGLKTANAVLGGVLDRQEQHRGLPALRAQPRAQLDAIHLRHHDVEHEQVEVAVEHRVETLPTVVRDLGRIAFGLEVFANPVGEVRFVVDDENTRCLCQAFVHFVVGQRIVTVAPCPGPSLRASIRAPESSASRRTM